MELFPGAVECVGCGYCCIKATCVVGARHYGETKPCPALEWDEVQSRHTCSFCTYGDKFVDVQVDHYRQELSVGAGCCMSLFNTWREDIRDRTKVVLEGSLANPLPSMLQMFLKCLGAESSWMSPIILENTADRFKMELQLEGYDEETAKVLVNWIWRCLHQNRSNMMDDMMGKMKDKI